MITCQYYASLLIILFIRRGRNPSLSHAKKADTGTMPLSAFHASYNVVIAEFAWMCPMPNPARSGSYSLIIRKEDSRTINRWGMMSRCCIGSPLIDRISVWDAV